MSNKELVDVLNDLALVADGIYFGAGVNASVRDMADKAKEMANTIAAYKMAVKSLEMKLTAARKEAREAKEDFRRSSVEG